MSTTYSHNFKSDSQFQIKGPKTFVSAIDGALQRLAAGIKIVFNNWIQNRVDRQAFSHLLTLDDHILKDIGLTRDDVVWASRLPVSVNASLELGKTVRINRTT
ncbi:MAG: DUF1127 domain-containing protein [Hyphomicrobiales bacterium]|nr:DUF1127 domain-containing protein [Hyphomicrobiales bacterium]